VKQGYRVGRWSRRTRTDLAAADRLFYQQGIHATGVAALAEEAHVSTRTLYQHFATKNALVEAYLRRREGEASIPSEMELERDDLPRPSDF
jgi:AcrR family transcriptional regulator